MLRAIVYFHVNDMKEMNVLNHSCRMDVTKNPPKQTELFSTVVCSSDGWISRIVRTCLRCMYPIYGNVHRRASGGGFFAVMSLPKSGFPIALRRVKSIHTPFGLCSKARILLSHKWTAFFCRARTSLRVLFLTGFYAFCSPLDRFVTRMNKMNEKKNIQKLLIPTDSIVVRKYVDNVIAHFVLW